jgi:hypothetical protein
MIRSQGNATAMIAFNGNFDEAIETLIKNSLALPAGQGVTYLEYPGKGCCRKLGTCFFSDYKQGTQYYFYTFCETLQPLNISGILIRVPEMEMFYWHSMVISTRRWKVVYNQLSVAALNPGVHRLGLACEGCGRQLGCCI